MAQMTLEPPLRCNCGHVLEDHLYHKIPDGGGGRIENDNQKCLYWEGCGCDGFIADEPPPQEATWRK